MALTNLTSLTQAQYQALNINSFSTPPVISSTGNPDGAIAPQLGGWVGTDVLAFMILNGQNTNSGLSIDPRNTNTIDANVVPGSNPSTVTTYWTVNMGTNASNGNWEISVQVDANNTNTGTWKFTKGKNEDEDVKY